MIRRTEQFMALKELYMKSGQGFVLVFSLTQLGSVSELGPLREQIVRIKNAKVGVDIHFLRLIKSPVNTHQCLLE